MKTCKERTEGVLQKLEEKKAERKKRAKKIRNIAISGCAGAFALTALNLWLFIPYSTSPTDLSAYKDSEYYSLMRKINEVTYTPPAYKNNYEKYVEGFFGSFALGCGGAYGGDKDIGADMMGGATMAPSPDTNAAETAPSLGAPESGDGYQETTDNQVAGVIEGDLFKRSDRYIFYLSRTGSAYTLRVYSIDKENSALLSTFEIEPEENTAFSSDYYDGCAAEMYLSDDCTRITILAPCTGYTPENGWRTHTAVIGVDVSDAADIKIAGRTYLSGYYNTSRKADGALLIVNNFTVSGNPDFSDEAEFLPQYGGLGEMQSVAAADIHAPEAVTRANYTAVYTVDEKTLETTDSAAFLSYSEDVYVSAESLYVTRSYSEWKALGERKYSYTDTTEISRISYAGETLEYGGSFTVAGSVKDQYSMDEYEGLLRVVTTTNTTVYQESVYGETIGVGAVENGDSASLYLIDFDRKTLVNSVENFAPQGETVQSVRFDREKAYVCTAIVLTDPVFAFDLSDIHNITYTDTGEIDGYSTSLVDFGENLLLGIGYGDGWDTLKIETYAESETAVEPLHSFELTNCYFSTDYKSYLIDRENKLIGIGVNAYNEKYAEEAYLLLGYGTDGFTLLATVEMEGDNALKRAAYIDGYLYVFGGYEDGFAVRKIV